MGRNHSRPKKNNGQNHSPQKTATPDESSAELLNSIVRAIDSSKCRYGADDKMHGWKKPITRAELFMIFLTAIYVFAACFQWSDISGQLGEMKKQNEQTAAALIQGKAAIEIAKDTARKQLRAYLDFESASLLDPNLENSPYGGFQAEIRNYGQTPAYKISLQIDFAIKQILPEYNMGKLPVDFDYNIPQADDSVRGVMGGQVGHLSPGQSAPAVMMLDSRDAVFTNPKILSNALIYFYGEIDYSDIYGNAHRNYFCFLYSQIGAQDGHVRNLIPYGPHNGEHDVQ